MRIRLVPLALASVAASVAVVAAVSVGVAFLPILKRIALGVHPAMGGAGVAVIIGVVTALILALNRGSDAKEEESRSGPRPNGPNNSLERSRDR
jgi:hypothetical protein